MMPSVGPPEIVFSTTVVRLLVVALWIFWRVEGSIPRGWALVQNGRGEEGISQLQEEWTALQATGAQMTQALFRATLAEAYGLVGWAQEGLAVLAEALEIVDKLGDRINEAELYRLKGELLLAQAGKRQK